MIRICDELIIGVRADGGNASNLIDTSKEEGEKITKAEFKKARNAYIATLRRNAYRKESDPLWIEAQIGEASKADHEAKVQEIKERYPKL